jgi:glycine/D-amino acid oxidase-like deaminating enzyme
MNLSYWEQTEMLDYDLVVVGGGIVGYFTSIYYAQRYPNAKIVIVERGLFSSGASTKNAGFSCIGSLSELQDDLTHMSSEALIDLVLKRYQGLKELQKVLGTTNIDYQEVGGYELTFELPDKDKITYFNDLLEKALQSRPFEASNHKIKEFGFSKQIKGLIKNNLEGTVNTGKLMVSLQNKATSLGVQSLTLANVLSVEEENNFVKVVIGQDNPEYVLKAQQVALCTNAFSKQFCPDIDLNPGRGLVMVSKPIPNASIKGSFHYHNGYNYFRFINGRLLLGGGRHLDKEGEATTEFGVNETLKTQLLHDANQLIVPHHTIELDYTWSGIMAFGSQKIPLIHQVSDRVVAGVRLGGMGVAIGCIVARDIVHRMP